MTNFEQVMRAIAEINQEIDAAIAIKDKRKLDAYTIQLNNLLRGF